MAVTVGLFIWDQLPVSVVALLVPLLLWSGGVLELDDALAGFGDPTILFIAGLFVVSTALEATGVTAWVGNLAIRVAGESPSRLMVTVLLLVALVTALLTPNGSIAALTPVVVALAVRAGRSPSQLLLPAAFSAHAGSLLMLTGTPVTVVIADYLESVTGNRLGLFAIALAGVPLVLTTILLVVLLGSRLVPERAPRTALRDFGSHGETLGVHYALAGESGPLMGRDGGVGEFMIPPRSPVIGSEVYRGMITESGELVVAAVHRKGHDVQERIRLAAGDSLLLQGSWQALEEAARTPDLLAVDDPTAVRRQAVPFGPGATKAVIVLVGMVILLATGVVPAAVAGIVAGIAMIVLRVIAVDTAYHGISWTTLILVGGMMSLATAMVSSGAAQTLAESLVALTGPGGPYALLAGLFIMTALMGQLISNMATALIVIPIGFSAATEMGISSAPVLLAVAVFSAGALLTPVATPANLVVMEAAGYRFSDYWRLGLPLLLVYGLVGTFLVPVFWPF
nr:SLC13 family permease [Ornithinimicrobium cryptoxanthini]